MTNVLIADDHTLVRDGLRHVLLNASGFEVAGEARDAATTIALSARKMHKCWCSTGRCRGEAASN